jgi:hypothetical protein
MNPNIPLSHTLAGIIICVVVSYLLTAAAAWLCNHPSPFRFWREQ